MLNSHTYPATHATHTTNCPSLIAESANNIGSLFDSTQEMMQVINAQNSLIIKLLRKQNMLYQDLQQTKESSHSSDNRPSRNNTILCMPYLDEQSLEHSSTPLSSSDNEFNDKIAQNKLKISKTSKFHSKIQKNVLFESGAQSYEQKTEQAHQKRKQSESKNMVKNFAKGIFNFIRCQPQWRNKVLTRVGVEEQNFMRAYTELKGRIHSISDLRALWSESNPLSSAFRVLSFQYLRRHYLKKVFNSRIENHAIHIKYRKRLMEALESPEDFTSLKTD